MRNEAIKFGIQEYNKETGKQMELQKIEGVTVSQRGCHKIFFVTFIGSVIETNVSIESSELVEKGTTTNEDIYQAVVSYDTLNRTPML
ncbi:hypothetical protein LINPERHAP2_LOCUS14908 [Linum perenne]